LTLVAYEATGDQLGCPYRHEIFDASMVAVTSSRQHCGIAARRR
jgi:hypothetical protein